MTVRETTLTPDLEQLNDLLLNYGQPMIHVPLMALRAGVTPWEVSVSLLFTDITDLDYQSPMKWRKAILERIEALTEAMRAIGWVIHGRTSIKFDSRFDPPTCTLSEKLVKPGEEGELSASIDFVVLPIKGELIEESQERSSVDR